VSLHPGQTEAWDSTARFTFIFAGTQSGKTSFMPLWMWREIQRTWRQGEPNDYLAVTASYDLFKLKLLPAFRELFEHTLRVGRYWSGSRVIELADPATGEFRASRCDDAMAGRIILRSASAGGGLESATARAAVLDECGLDEFPLEAWEAVLRRLSLSQGRVLAGTTVYNLGWTKAEVYDRWARGDPDYRVVQFDSTENPAFPAEEFQRARDTMPEWRFRMLYQGQFARYAGMVYDCWDESLHVVDDHPLPPSWPRWVGIDPGAVNTAMVWLAENPDTGVFTLYRESLRGGLSTRDHCRRAVQDGALENVAGWFGGAPSEDQQRMDWAAEGVPVMRPPVSDVEAGIARVYALLKARRLVVFRSCRGVLDEIGSYRRRVDANGQVLEEIVDKRAFHRMDALRYVVAGAAGGRVQYARHPWG
jgi:hypothetical protein